MSKTVNCFIPFADAKQVEATVAELKSYDYLVKTIYLLQKEEGTDSVEGCEVIKIDGLNSSKTIKKIAEHADADYVLLYTKYDRLKFGVFALDRFVKIAEDTEAGMLYADHYNGDEPDRTKAPVIDYQMGSLRDDFDFGSVLFFCAEAFKKAASMMKADYEHAGLYDLRLKLSQFAALEHINEFLYSDIELDTRKSGEKMFDYVDPRTRGRQIEMEQAVTEHLKEIGGYLAPEFKHIEFGEDKFAVEASVIIPVRTRERTIADAIESALMQKTDFPFNVIIIDNCSTDRTTEIIREDTHDLFGFPSKGERALFDMLMTVSGIGANTARMILSAFSASEVRQIIATGNAKALSQVKGLGPKTAQRVIVDLKDKVLKVELEDGAPAGVPLEIPDMSSPAMEVKEEAVGALTMLGFPAAASGKVADKILREDPTLPVEKVIKLALKML